MNHKPVYDAFIKGVGNYFPIMIEEAQSCTYNVLVIHACSTWISKINDSVNFVTDSRRFGVCME